jgi:hypothetical protein
MSTNNAPKFVSDYKIFTFGNRITGKLSHAFFPLNKLEASKMRFGRKINKTDVPLEWFITLTFANESKKYQIENHNFYCRHTLDDVLNFEQVINKKRDIRVFGISAFMRRYMNLIKTRLRHKEIELSYAYMYEQGEKGNRPHYHMLISDIGIDNEQELFEFLYESWGAGNIQIERVANNKDKIANYLNAYLNKEKSFKHDKFTGKRFWNTSRDIKRVESNPDYQFIGICRSIDIAKLLEKFIVANEHLSFVVDHTLLNQLYTERKELFGGMVYNNILFNEFPYEIFQDFFDKDGFHEAQVLYLKPDVLNYTPVQTEGF